MNNQTYAEYKASLAEISEREATVAELTKQLDFAKVLKIKVPNDFEHQEHHIAIRSEITKLEGFIEVETKLIDNLKNPIGSVDDFRLNLP